MFFNTWHCCKLSFCPVWYNQAGELLIEKGKESIDINFFCVQMISWAFCYKFSHFLFFRQVTKVMIKVQALSYRTWYSNFVLPFYYIAIPCHVFSSLFERQSNTQRDRNYYLNSCNNSVWVKWNWELWNQSIQVTHMSGRDPRTWVITNCLRRFTLPGSWVGIGVRCRLSCFVMTCDSQMITSVGNCFSILLTNTYN